MGWETMYDKLEQSKCACGKGVVVRHSYLKMDDFNRTESGYYGEKIKCDDCQERYQIEHYIRHFPSKPWKSDGISDIPYLVPNSMTLKHDSQKAIDDIISQSHELEFEEVT